MQLQISTTLKRFQTLTQSMLAAVKKNDWDRFQSLKQERDAYELELRNTVEGEQVSEEIAEQFSELSLLNEQLLVVVKAAQRQLHQDLVTLKQQGKASQLYQANQYEKP